MRLPLTLQAQERRTMRDQMPEGVQEHERLLEMLQESQERHALAARGANDGLWEWNLKTNEAFFAPRWKSMLGYQEDEIGNDPYEWFNRVHPEDLDRMWDKIALHLQGATQHFEDEYRMLHRDGSYRWVLNRGLALWNASGEAYRIAGSQTDVTGRKVAEQRLQHEAFHDALTGLPNRALFMFHLRKAIEHERQRAGYVFAVLFLNLDHFQAINDSLGYMVGDHLLAAVARKLVSCLRPGDTIARLWGDEFAILLNAIHDASDAIHVTGRIQEKLAQPVDLYGQQALVSASIGIAPSSIHYERPEDLLRAADMAMRHAKSLGGACYQLYDAPVHDSAPASPSLEAELRRAIERQEFVLHYQPIVSLDDGKVVGVEALLRWQHPRRGLLDPAEFIPLAEETGLITPLGEWVLRTACAQNGGWREAGCPPLRMAVNLSTRQFQDQNLVELVKDVLRETSTPAHSLELEITERIATTQNNGLCADLNELSATGTQISIDDFGIGYSWLGNLKLFPIQTLKIDQSFVKGVTANASDAAIVTAIITMAHSFGFKVIAEGVETEDQLVFLRAQGCDEIQGHLFSPPVPAETLRQILQEEKSL